MTIFNLGSVNIDRFYALPHLPQPGETLSASNYSVGLGGKGVNQSVAAARAGAKVHHIGAIGQSDNWVRERIESYGVDCTYLRALSGNTGHAIIYVDAAAENTIVLDAGTNAQQDGGSIAKAIELAKPDDTLLLQNETNLQSQTAKLALDKGLRVIYSAAPFSIEAVKQVLPHVSILVMNEVEAEQLCGEMGVTLDKIPVPQVLVTLGAKGAMWRSNKTGEVIEVTAPKVTAVDTTAAGDTFAGYFASGLDLSLSIRESMEWATQAAALKVTRHGTADAIPTAAEVAAV
ncbi:MULTISPECIES: ribokinase [Pacificibacter]|uniref:ribokinase n=1 Tax=Pacificibacter TaxID=1042323 RepID=UPI001C0985F6|nr:MULTISPECIES: ribokinase [Pacificibacter]MBU2936136.1 ribokinase [Pacificibacter marinus]MDO6615014.1 ribokinase [Pacificibacter sp. 1_MG-2023]